MGERKYFLTYLIIYMNLKYILFIAVYRVIKSQNTTQIPTPYYQRYLRTPKINITRQIVKSKISFRGII